MTDVMAVDIKKWIEFGLSLTITILFVVSEAYDDSMFIDSEFTVTATCLAYLGLVILMALARREFGASTPLEAVFGVHALNTGVAGLRLGTDYGTSFTIALILDIILGLMLIIFILF
jgi:hypothetical protein